MDPAPGAAGPDGEMDEALRALAEPRRRAILRLVARSGLSAGEIAGCFEVTRTAVSQHLTVLKHAGLLTERRQATRRLYRARPEGLAALREFLDQLSASPLRRPPVRQSVVVRSDRPHTFGTFVRTIGAWWPAAAFSAGGTRSRT